MINKIKKIDSVFIMLFLARGLQAGLTIIGLRLLTEVLPKNEVGQYYLINSIIYWFSIVLINPVGMYVNRRIHEWQKLHQLRWMFKKINLYFTYVALLSIPVIYFLFDKIFANDLIEKNLLLIYFFSYLFFSSWFQSIISYFNILHYQKTFLMLSILGQSIGLLTAFILTKFYSQHALIWLFGILFGQALSFLFSLILFYKYEFKNEIKIEKKRFFNKELFNFCYPIAITTFFMWFQNQGYRIYFQDQFGLEMLANLAVGLGISSGISSSFEQVIMQYYYPYYYSEISVADKDGRRKAWEKLWKKSVVWYIFAWILIVITAPISIRIFAAKQYADYAIYIAIGACIDLVRQMTNIVYIVAHSEKNTKTNILPYFFGACGLMFFVYFLKKINMLSGLSMSICLLLSGLITFVVISIQAKKNLNINFIKGASL